MALVHYWPETLGSDSLQGLDVLKGKFPLNRLMEGSSNPFFPDQILGAGATGWCLSMVESLTDEFFRRLGITPNYQLANFGTPPNRIVS
jgi:hypothetical protein